MLNRHIEKDKWSFVEVQKIFIKESDCIVPITNEKALSFRKFIDISIDYDLFSEEKTYKFIEGNEIEQNFLKILENINEKVQIFKLRFIKAKEYNYTNKRIIDNLELKFKGQNFEERDKKILLISYRLIEEESKRIILESEIDSLMPMEIREIRHIYEERILF